MFRINYKLLGVNDNKQPNFHFNLMLHITILRCGENEELHAHYVFDKERSPLRVCLL